MGFYIQAIVPVFCLISLITYLVYASALGKYDVKILLGLGLGCVLGALQLFLQIGVFELLSSVLISVTLFYFITLTETIGSYADYLNNIVAFGHSELIGRIPFATCLPASTFAAVRRSSIRPLVQDPITT